MAGTTRIALVGIGKIARDQHVPTIAASDRFELVAGVTHHTPLEGIPCFRTIAEMAKAVEVDVVSICTPPRGRTPLIAEALAHGYDVMIEKPPAATLSEAEAFADMALGAGKVLYATWHSREAAGVEPSRQWIAGRKLKQVTCIWKEDVRVWHPGQEWIWEPGIGVFDPGINALSVLTRILPDPMLLQSATLGFPANKAAPIAADLEYETGGAPLGIAFDFDQRGPQTWDIIVEAENGQLKLSMGASKLEIDGKPVDLGEDPEYHRLYRRFADLLDARESDIDLTPFRHVADAFLLGQRTELQSFDWNG